MVDISSSSRLIAVVLLFLGLAACVSTASGQTYRGRNNPYSPSPSTKQKVQETHPNGVKPPSGPETSVTQDVYTVPTEYRPTIAQRTYAIAKAADLSSRPATDIYKVGIGDVLFVDLKNASQGSGYVTVRADGTIDFPLAGDHVVVADQPVDAIQEILESSITLYTEPQVEVSVREYASHMVHVSGMVSNPGDKGLQREAVPLFVLRAEAIVEAKASRVVVTRGEKSETYDLKDTASDNVLIYPGDSVDFKGDGQMAGVYFLSGDVNLAGQKELLSGMTLYQALVASGGANGNAKKAIIRRKTDKGVFAIFEHNLRSIRDGKAIDPPLSTGDIIEIRK